jgi:hypothetical protein
MRRLLLSVALAISGFVASANAQSSAPTEPVTQPERLVYSSKEGETTFTFGHGEAVLSNRVQLWWRERRREVLGGERLFNIPRARTEVTGCFLMAVRQQMARVPLTVVVNWLSQVK